MYDHCGNPLEEPSGPYLSETDVDRQCRKKKGRGRSHSGSGRGQASAHGYARARIKGVGGRRRLRVQRGPSRAKNVRRYFFTQVYIDDKDMPWTIATSKDRSMRTLPAARRGVDRQTYSYEVPRPSAPAVRSGTLSRPYGRAWRDLSSRHLELKSSHLGVALSSINFFYGIIDGPPESTWSPPLMDTWIAPLRESPVRRRPLGRTTYISDGG
ncbi:hypothetical protein EVAR_82064_1 [Eumeta japonica]|uniref:Uncharacterized protein n=1 Tax=Eumeta variegata TaxID=151549 RepID=A0A4C1U1K6_EUMVA|nr:hypothetical protein EVAR_82064_1 [Eumeta japonica]